MADEPAGVFSLNEGVTRAQHGALCWRLHRGSVQVLLISSRDTRRWIIPKGWPIDGLSPAQTALREAWEEAGVIGEAEPVYLGLYPYEKVMPADCTIPCVVSVFAVKVSRLRTRFPERKERRRKWYSLTKAATRVDEPALRALVCGFAPPSADGGEPLLSPADPVSAGDPNSPAS